MKKIMICILLLTILLSGCSKSGDVLEVGNGETVDAVPTTNGENNEKISTSNEDVSQWTDNEGTALSRYIERNDDSGFFDLLNSIEEMSPSNSSNWLRFTEDNDYVYMALGSQFFEPVFFGIVKVSKSTHEASVIYESQQEVSDISNLYVYGEHIYFTDIKHPGELLRMNKDGSDLRVVFDTSQKAWITTTYYDNIVYITVNSGRDGVGVGATYKADLNDYSTELLMEVGGLNVYEHEDELYFIPLDVFDDMAAGRVDKYNLVTKERSMIAMLNRLCGFELGTGSIQSVRNLGNGYLLIIGGVRRGWLEDLNMYIYNYITTEIVEYKQVAYGITSGQSGPYVIDGAIFFSYIDELKMDSSSPVSTIIAKVDRFGIERVEANNWEFQGISEGWAYYHHRGPKNRQTNGFIDIREIAGLYAVNMETKEIKPIYLPHK